MPVGAGLVVKPPVLVTRRAAERALFGCVGVGAHPKPQKQGQGKLVPPCVSWEHSGAIRGFPFGEGEVAPWAVPLRQLAAARPRASASGAGPAKLG